MSTVNERVSELVVPLVQGLGLELWDVEYGGGVVRVVIDRPGGVDLEAISQTTRLLSRQLDHDDPVPGRYTLEVTSPGLERALRRPHHFVRSIGATVSVRTRPGVEGERRMQGTLVAADDETFVVRPESPAPQTDGADPADRVFRYDEVERAHTVFEWGPAPKPGGPNPRKSRQAAKTPGEPSESKRHDERGGTPETTRKTGAA